MIYCNCVAVIQSCLFAWKKKEEYGEIVIISEQLYPQLVILLSTEPEGNSHAVNHWHYIIVLFNKEL